MVRPPHPATGQSIVGAGRGEPRPCCRDHQGVRDKGSGRAWGEHRGPLPATWGAPVLIIISYSYGSFLGNCFILHGI